MYFLPLTLLPIIKEFILHVDRCRPANKSLFDLLELPSYSSPIDMLLKNVWCSSQFSLCDSLRVVVRSLGGQEPNIWIPCSPCQVRDVCIDPGTNTINLPLVLTSRLSWGNKLTVPSPGLIALGPIVKNIVFVSISFHLYLSISVCVIFLAPALAESPISHL